MIYLANYKFDLAEGLDPSGMVGGNVRRNYNTNDYTSTEGGLVKTWFILSINSASTILPTWEKFCKIGNSRCLCNSFLGYKDLFLRWYISDR